MTQVHLKDAPGHISMLGPVLHLADTSRGLGAPVCLFVVARRGRCATALTSTRRVRENVLHGQW